MMALDDTGKTHAVPALGITPTVPKSTRSTKLPPRPSLADEAARIKKALRDGASADLRVAEILVPILNNWESYRSESGGLDANEWAEMVTGNKSAAKRYSELLRAAERCEACVEHVMDRQKVRYSIPSEVLITLGGGSVPEDKRREAIVAVSSACARTPVSRHQARRIIAQTVGRRPRISSANAKLQECVQYFEALNRWMIDHDKALARGQPGPKLPAPHESIAGFATLAGYVAWAEKK